MLEFNIIHMEIQVIYGLIAGMCSCASVMAENMEVAMVRQCSLV